RPQKEKAHESVGHLVYVLCSGVSWRHRAGRFLDGGALAFREKEKSAALLSKIVPPRVLFHRLSETLRLKRISLAFPVFLFGNGAYYYCAPAQIIFCGG
ncbi:MAG: hypothetical protein ACOYI3_02180, partial [Christensenellales bacterium]